MKRGGHFNRLSTVNEFKCQSSQNKDTKENKRKET